MTGKLLRFEFRSTARILGGLYLALILLSVVNRVTTGIGLLDREEFSVAVASGIMLMALYIVCAIATLLFTVIMIVLRFWRNLLENQGYLMHTLPVRTRDHIIVKLAVAFAWIVVSCLVFLISVWILSMNSEEFLTVWPKIGTVLGELFSYKGGVLCFLLGIVIAILLTLAEILKLYAAMSMGQTLREHRIVASIGAYVGINALESIFEMALILLLGIESLNGKLNDVWMNYLIQTDATGEVTSLTGMAVAMSVYLLIPLLYCGVYFFVTNHFLGKKLNLV